jgi:MFS family permease
MATKAEIGAVNLAGVAHGSALVSSSLPGARWSSRFSTRRIYLVGLVADLVAMALLLLSELVTSNESVAYPILLLATASLGIGFGFTVPAGTGSAALEGVRS